MKRSRSDLFLTKKRLLLGAFVQSILLFQAGAQSSNLHLRLEPRTNSIDIVVDGVAAAGVFWIYRADSLENLSNASSLALQTNTVLTNGSRFSFATPGAAPSQSFFTAIHWPGLLITNMVWIPSGTFTMGSPDNEPGRYSHEGPQTLVTISRGFWMGKYEVTQNEFLAVLGSNPSYYTPAHGFAMDLTRPVDSVSWEGAVAYCTALTTQERSAGRVPTNYAYRLSTEAEWEYACRAGTTTAFHYGGALRSGMENFNGTCEYPPCDNGGDINCCFNPSGTELHQTTSVGSYTPNALGLYDMHGNIGEWCSDWYGAYLGGSVTDSQGPSTGTYHVIRGGLYGSRAYRCRSAHRDYCDDPDGWYGNVGFRVVLAPSQP